MCVCVCVWSTHYVMCVMGRHAGSATGKCASGDFVVTRTSYRLAQNMCAVCTVHAHTPSPG